MPIRSDPNHYETLGIPRDASAAAVKQAYRHLVKQHHPDATHKDGERIRQINAAYSVLGHAESRRAYDQQSQPLQPQPTPTPPRSTVTDEAAATERWLQQIYTPLNRLLSGLLRSLQPELNRLAADPFDPDLGEAFERYLDESDQKFGRAQTLFRQSPNPSSVAGVATRLYYTLNHLEDALGELRYFTLNFDDRHLHTGQELFRRANELRSEAAEALRVMRR